MSRLGLGIIAAVFLPAAAVGQSQQARPLRSLADIVHVYHGVAADRDLNVLTVDPANLDAVLTRSIAQLSPRGAIATPRNQALRAALIKSGIEPAAAARAAQGATLDSLISRSPLNKRSERQAAAAWLAQQVQAADAAARPVGRRSAVDLSKIINIRDIDRKVSVRWLDPQRWRLPPIALTYGARCAAAGVPLPPNWGDPAWQKQGVVPQNLLFLALGNPVEAWASNVKGKGACIALPRWDANKTKVTLGIICQGAATGNACFWDNRPHAGGAPFTPAEMASKTVLKDWVNGTDAALSGGGKCVQCHRGENVFLIHPGTPLALPSPAFDTSSASWYKPINDLGWTNPPKTVLAGGGGCQSCHAIGNTSIEKESYCAILKKAATKEMPNQANPAGWTTPAATYAAHIGALKSNCAS